MEGKKYHAQIDKLVQRRAKFHEGDRVKIRGQGFTGIIKYISSITNINSGVSEIRYLVEPDKSHICVSYHYSQLVLIEEPQKVQFT